MNGQEKRDLLYRAFCQPCAMKATPACPHCIITRASFEVTLAGARMLVAANREIPEAETEIPDVCTNCGGALVDRAGFVWCGNCQKSYGKAVE